MNSEKGNTDPFAEELIKDARDRLILISPYLQLNDRVMELLVDKNRLKIDVRMVCGMLARKLGLKTTELTDKLLASGHLELKSDKPQLTDNGQEVGGELRMSPRFGSYFPVAGDVDGLNLVDQTISSVGTSLPRAQCTTEQVMCYSAQIVTEHRKFEREYGATISIRRYVELFWEKRNDGGWLKIPKAMRADWGTPRNTAERELAELVAAADDGQAAALRDEMAAQVARLATATQVLVTRPTKKAANDQRVARDKIERAQRQLDDLARTQVQDRDSRMFPGQYAPVLIEQDGARVVVPMRYQCRLPGWSALTERKYPGTYNARRDKLQDVWGKLFGYQHGIMLINAFYENVSRAAMEHRPLAEGEADENVVLEFRPVPAQDLLVACLWSRAAELGKGELFSFAAITDDPPAEIAAIGHDRCVVPVKPGDIDAWLRPDPANLAAQFAILDDRARPWYEHRKTGS